jgi:hypothetical protein
MAEAQPQNPINLDAIIRASQIPDAKKYLYSEETLVTPENFMGLLTLSKDIYNVWMTYIYNKVQGPANEQLEVSHTPIV